MERDYRYSADMHKRFFDVRKALGLTQKEIGNILGITPGYYSKLESVETPIKKSVVISVCKTLDVRFEYLVYGEAPMFNSDDRRKRRLLELFDGMPEANQDFLLKFLEFQMEEGPKAPAD